MTSILPQAYLESLLALVVWRETRGEPDSGVKAVIHVILNRVKAGWGTLDHVITKANQFSSMTTHGDPELVVWPGDLDERFLEIWRWACEALTNPSASDPSNGACYYENPTTANSLWFTENIVNKPDQHPVTAQIEHHTFYR